MEGRRGSDPELLEDGSEPDGRPPSEPSDDHDSSAQSRRRRVLERLLAHGGRMESSELADELVAAEHGTATEEVPNDRAKLVRLDLHHSHLPKLADEGVLRYEPASGLIELDDADRAKRLLETWTDAH